MNRVGAVDADTDTLALLSFKSVVSDSQNVLSGWNQNSSHCTWFGVTCANKGTRVQSLRLAGYGLSVGLCHCYNLEEIYFKHIQLIGNLPSELGDLSRLRILDVAVNNLTDVIPPTFGNLSSLTVLSLARNQFFAKIPNELGHLHNLQKL
ncbi:hypothetical protein VitviT2T_028025 [Vitis vinifera]|uniref:Leucine-rich repeat-containing N-terminal plant-type domain-containing protein n=1 Tax=Vitis vinifera TaxID=29760 RepID=A0ABY9DVN5_VITVI|nr:hypothetical protein VitviT2T_028025 [Vitis vinifera]